MPETRFDFTLKINGVYPELAAFLSEAAPPFSAEAHRAMGDLLAAQKAGAGQAPDRSSR